MCLGLLHFLLQLVSKIKLCQEFYFTGVLLLGRNKTLPSSQALRHTTVIWPVSAAIDAAETHPLGFTENRIYRPFLRLLYFSLPSTEQLGPVTCELTLPLHSLFLPTCFCHHRSPSTPPILFSLPPRWTALLWESLCIKGRGYLSCQPIGSMEEVCLQLSGSRMCSCEKFSQTMAG